MKTLKAIPLLCALVFTCTVRGEDTPAAKKPDVVDDLLQCANGDTVHGSVAGFDKEGLHWLCVFTPQPFLFHTANLVSIQFHPRKAPPNPSARLGHDVLLVNGDLFPGAVVSFNDTSLVLDTWYAGKLTIPRAMVQSITATGILYMGPIGLDEWVTGPAPKAAGWTCKDRVLSGGGDNTTIGRDLKLPTVSRIEFDLDAGGGSQVDIHICSDQVKTPGNSYMFHLSFAPASATQTIGFARYTPGKPVVITGGLVLPMNGKEERHHFDIRIDRAAKSICLYLDRNTVSQFLHLDDLAKMGSGLLFSTGQPHDLLDVQTPIAISKIIVSRWNARPHGDDISAPGDDCIKQTEHDSVHGKLKAISGGKALFTTPRGDVEIPLPQIEWIQLSPGDAGQAKAAGDAVCVQFLLHGGATMEIESWDARGITATSPDFGRAVFLPGTFRSLQFKPDQAPPAAAGEGDDYPDP